ncbi:hypothetical protein DL96DRAFT_1579900 [Flagelloscypha sp. PMI_526]|nr:hypothetical protein DL96DRAFT_1579900 [Flagelloscypha sp. PMI_526]
MNLHTDASSSLSAASTQGTALEICHLVYGDPPEDMEALERMYEPNAGAYENPFLTATSRALIADIIRLSRHFSHVDIPRPLAVVYAILRLKQPKSYSSPWLKAVKVWTEVGDISESDSFGTVASPPSLVHMEINRTMLDGHRKTIVEHTLNILLLPGIHNEGLGPVHHDHSPRTPSSSLVSTSAASISPSTRLSTPCLPVPLTSLSIPSPFHLKLPIITRLNFNEQSIITHHRDFWDVRDLMGLCPGMSLVQWITTRMVARGLSFGSRWFFDLGSSKAERELQNEEEMKVTSDQV